MFRTALRELRHHPGRYLAILIAIAISVGFMTAASVVTATESQAMAKVAGAPYTKADMVVTVNNVTTDCQTMDCQDERTAGSQLADMVRQASPLVTLAWPEATTYLLVTNNDASTYVNTYAAPPVALSWATVGSPPQPVGATPLGPDDIVIDSKTASALGARVGSTVDVDSSGGTTTTLHLTVVGITNDLSNLYAMSTAFIAADTFDAVSYSGFVSAIIVNLKPGSDVAQASQAIQTAMKAAGVDVTATTGIQAAQQAGVEATQGFDIFKYVVWVFAAIALVVGMITIANTFAILLTQRRRQLGLLRAVGASGSQVRRSIWIEAGALGLIGSLLGVGIAYLLAAAVGAYTGSIRVGLATPWRDLAIGVAIGVVITVLASSLPARRATRWPVLDALRPPEADVRRFRVPVVRTVVCGLLLVVGLSICIYSLLETGGTRTLLIAIGGAMLVSLGVLFGAPLFVPGLLRGVGALVARLGTVAGIAVKNTTRDPARAAGTATALMLAVGLIVTLQVGASSIQSTVHDKISSRYPIDFWVEAYDPMGDGTVSSLPEDTRQRMAGAAGIEDSVVLTCRSIGVSMGTGSQSTSIYGQVACAYDPAITRIAGVAPASVADNQVLVNPSNYSSIPNGDTITVTPLEEDSSFSTDGVPVTTVYSNLVRDTNIMLVSPATLAKLAAPGSPEVQAVMLFSVYDATTAMASISKIPSDGLMSGGSAVEREMIDQVLNVIVYVVTALLAVAVLIALVGVSGTLTLSVVERTRESALLRALGLRRGQLRLMLLIEAILLTLVGALVGVLFGAFFGYVGAHAMIGQIAADTKTTMAVHLSINWTQTLGLLGVLVVAAGLASTLPGRRAAAASPVEALAEV